MGNPVSYVRGIVVSVLENLGSKMAAEPEEYGYTEGGISALVETAEGESITRESLLGTSYQKATIEILNEGEQPHHKIPGSDVAVEGNGRETEGVSGNILVTENRVIYTLFDMGSRSRNTVDYSAIDAVEYTEGPVHDRLTLQAGSRTLTMKTASSEWGEELEEAKQTIREIRSPS